MKTDISRGARGSDRIEFANSLRGVAAVSVVIAHLGQMFWVGQPVVALFTGLPALSLERPWFTKVFDVTHVDLGPFGVGLFFVISGFVIPFSLVRYDARAFLTGRLLRIYPTYWVGFSITAAAILIGAAFFGGATTFTAKELTLHYFPPLRAIFYSRALDGIAWTLEIELFFYLLCATIAGAIGRGRRWVGFVPLVLFAAWLPAFAFVAHAPAGFEKIARRFEVAADYLPFVIFMFTGVALNFRQRGLIGRGAASAWIGACVAMFMLAWATQFLGEGWLKLMVGLIDPEAYLLALALFLIAMAGQNYFTAHPALRFVAAISYPLYVVHGVAGYVMLQILVGHGVGPTAALAATLIAVFVAAWLIHRFVETPTHSYGQKLARGMAAQDRAGAAAQAAIS